MPAHYEAYEYLHEGQRCPVFIRGTGPAIIVMHEIPGMTPEVIRFGDYLVEAGFTVLMPSLFGTPDRPFSPAYLGETTVKVCIRREFSLLAANKASPMTEFMRALCRDAHAKYGGPGVGALGMCLTGNFALSLMVDESVMAPVLSQPSLPIAVTKAQRAALHITDEELSCVRRRVREDGVKVLGVRFTNDPLCPPERFETLRRELGEGFEGIEIDSAPGNAHGISRLAHSVLTKDLVDEAGHPTRVALDRVIAFFRERLQVAA